MYVSRSVRFAAGAREYMFLQSDTEAAVHWVRRCRRGKEPLSVRQPWPQTHPPSLCANVGSHLSRFFQVLELFRVSGGLPFFLLSKVGVNYHASPFLAYIAHAWGSEGLTAGTIAGHLAVAKLFHRLGRRLELFLRHS